MYKPAAQLRKVATQLRLRRARYRTIGRYVALGELVRRLSEQFQGPAGSVDLTPFEYRVFSQNGEDGVLVEILRRIGQGNRSFAEIGAGNGVEGNCVFLADVLGWNGVFIDGSSAHARQLGAKYSKNDRVQTRLAMVSPSTIDDVLLNAGMAEEPDIVSIDIDGNDYWIWEGMERIRPRVIVVEYNGSLDLAARLVQPYSPESRWNASGAFGASLGALEDLGLGKGYRLVHTDLTGTNAFFCRQELCADMPDPVDVARRTANYYLDGVRFPEGPTEHFIDPAEVRNGNSAGVNP